MAIKVQETLTSSNNYPVVKSSDIKGGLVVVSSIDDLSDISESRLVDGSLAYVSEEKKYYKYDLSSNKWVVFSAGSVLIGDDEKDAVDGSLFLSGENIDVSDLVVYLNFLKSQIETLRYTTTTELKSEDVTLDNLNNDFELYQTYSFGDIYKLKHLGLKTITNEALAKIQMDNSLSRMFIDGEPIWEIDNNILYLYRKNKLYQIQGGGNGSTTSGDSITNNYYKLTIDSNGNLQLQSTSGRNPKTESGRTIASCVSLTNVNDGVAKGNFRLLFNSLYAGGDSNEHSYNPVSHNFVEITNLSDVDYSLDNVYLFYKKWNSNDIQSYKLSGTIKAWSSFTIRGKQCSVYSSNKTIIHLDDYDLSFNDMVLSNEGFSICLSCTDPESIGNYWKSFLSSSSSNDDPYLIDMFGCYDGDSTHNTVFSVNQPCNKLSSNGILYRIYPMDGARVPKIFTSTSKGDSGADYNLSWSNKWSLIQSTDSNFIKYTPLVTRAGKTVLFDKTLPDEDNPNYFNIIFGEQATDNGSGATRCFTWFSYNQYDESLVIRKDSTEVTYKSGYVYTYNNTTSTEQGPLLENLDGYNRYNTTNIATEIDGIPVLVHKVIVKGIPSGTYSAYIIRDNDDTYDKKYKDQPLEFTIRTNIDVISTGFEFIQVTDQQAFTELDYKVWKYVSDLITTPNLNESSGFSFTSFSPDFLINTGDITQNGNRVNEWLDYYKYKNSELHKVPEMPTIGNNDLAPVDIYKYKHNAGDSNKNNSRQQSWFYTFDYTTSNNPPIIASNDSSKQVFIDSCYYFDYGNIRFISLNSEVTLQAISNIYKVTGNSTSDGVYDNVLYTWLERTLTTDQYCIVYCHDAPFTIVAIDTWRSNYLGETSGSSEGDSYSVFSSKFDRAGSHLNFVPVTNKFNFQRLMEEKGVKLCLGGHKHTYAISYPILENLKNTMCPIVVMPESWGGTLVNVNCTYTPNVTYRLPSDWNTGISPYSNRPYIYASPNNTISQTDGVYYIPKPPMVTYMTYSEYQSQDDLKDHSPITYITLQASGQKLQSNKEQPIPEIGFIKQYSQAKVPNEAYGTTESTNPKYYATSVTAAKGQKHPMFTRIKVTTNVDKPIIDYTVIRTTNHDDGADTQDALVGNATDINNGKWRICTKSDMTQEVFDNFSGTIEY